jgi:hypothetical protein
LKVFLKNFKYKDQNLGHTADGAMTGSAYTYSILFVLGNKETNKICIETSPVPYMDLEICRWEYLNPGIVLASRHMRVRSHHFSFYIGFQWKYLRKTLIGDKTHLQMRIQDSELNSGTSRP